MTQLLRKCSGKFQSAELDGELMMIHGETGKFYALKDIGLEIWQRLDDQPDLGMLSADLAGEYDADEERIRKDVTAFADRIVRIGFAEYC